MVLISNLKPHEIIEGRYVVKFRKPVERYMKGYKFELRIGDSSGEIMLKYWGPNSEKNVKELFDSISPNDVIEIDGKTNEYNGRLELSLNENNKIKVLKPGEYDPTEFVGKTEKNIDEMFTELKQKIEGIEDPDLILILQSFFEDKEFTEAFKSAPAAMYRHQGYIGGLLEHTLNVVHICERGLEVFPALNKDLTIAGAILHDVGKIREFDVDTSIRTSTEGMLLGHMSTTLEMFDEKTRDLKIDENTRLKLKHILISHHGEREYGSIKSPAFPEALLIHLADNMDAKLEFMIQTKKNAKTEDDYIYTKDLGNIYLK